MSWLRPQHRNLARRLNRIGLEVQPYRGGKTTLCAGCGHNAISERIIDAFFEMGIDPRRSSSCRASAARARARRISSAPRTASTPCTAGCRRSGPARCWPTASCIAIGVSGDGDTGAIGIGQFVHLMRRNVPIDLHHRGQRLLRPDQGAVLADRRHRLDAEERRRQRPAADRHLRAGDRARRVVRRALVLRRQEAAAVDPQGVAQPSRHRA